MLVTFRSQAAGNVTMFGDIAVKLLRMTGHAGTVPGALKANQVADALERLRREIAAAGADDGNCAPEDDAEGPHVGLPLRAYPLIELLAAAARQERDVMWDEYRPLFT